MAPARICSSRGFAKADEKQVNRSSNNAAARIYFLLASEYRRVAATRQKSIQ
jgi:uncharacterized protein